MEYFILASCFQGLMCLVFLSILAVVYDGFTRPTNVANGDKKFIKFLFIGLVTTPLAGIVIPLALLYGICLMVYRGFKVAFR